MRINELYMMLWVSKDWKLKVGKLFIEPKHPMKSKRNMNVWLANEKKDDYNSEPIQEEILQ